MTELVKCPDGVEIDFVIYLISDSTGHEVRIGLAGMPAFVGFDKACDPAKLAQTAGLEQFAADWRMMSRAEIAAYKDNAANDDDGFEE